MGTLPLLPAERRAISDSQLLLRDLNPLIADAYSELARCEDDRASVRRAREAVETLAKQVRLVQDLVLGLR
jgi:hypothetical protein